MDSEPESFLPGHPLHVKPAGNAFGAKRNLLAASGLFSRIPEEFLNLTLEQLDAGALLRLGATCKALYAYCRTEELWRNLFIEYLHPILTTPFSVLFHFPVLLVPLGPILKVSVH